MQRAELAYTITNPLPIWRWRELARIEIYTCQLTSIFSFLATDSQSFALIPVFQSIPIVTALVPGAWLSIQKQAK